MMIGCCGGATVAGGPTVKGGSVGITLGGIVFGGGGIVVGGAVVEGGIGACVTSGFGSKFFRSFKSIKFDIRALLDEYRT
jgi:hypothetical protein